MSGVSIFVLPFAVIGVIVFVLAAVSFAREVIRSARQAARVAAVGVRVGAGERRKPSLKEYGFAFRSEFCSSYDSLIIGHVEIPHDPSKPLRDRFYG